MSNAATRQTLLRANLIDKLRKRKPPLELDEFIASRRATELSWGKIAVELAMATGGMTASPPTLKAWHETYLEAQSTPTPTPAA